MVTDLTRDDLLIALHQTRNLTYCAKLYGQPLKAPRALLGRPVRECLREEPPPLLLHLRRTSTEAPEPAATAEPSPAEARS